MNEKKNVILENEPRINLMEVLVDPLGDKAEIELRDTNTAKKKKNDEKRTAFIAGSMKEQRAVNHRKGGQPAPFLESESGPASRILIQERSRKKIRKHLLTVIVIISKVFR